MYLVDIPIRITDAGHDSAWEHVGSFKTKAEAVTFIRERIGPCDANGKISLLTKVEDN